MGTKEKIKEAIRILKSVKVRTKFEMEQNWYECQGYDADFDAKMKGYFKTINPLTNEELKKTMCDVWNATLGFYYTEPRSEKESSEEMTDLERMKKSVKAEDKTKGVQKTEIVNTNNGRRVLIIFKDGSRKLRSLYDTPKKHAVLNFDACEKELLGLSELGTHDFRSALAALLDKYSK